MNCFADNIRVSFNNIFCIKTIKIKKNLKWEILKWKVRTEGENFAVFPSFKANNVTFWEHSSVYIYKNVWILLLLLPTIIMLMMTRMTLLLNSLLKGFLKEIRRGGRIKDIRIWGKEEKSGLIEHLVKLNFLLSSHLASLCSDNTLSKQKNFRANYKLHAFNFRNSWFLLVWC